MGEVLSTFLRLPLPTAIDTSATNFAGAPIAATGHHVAKDARGRPAILLSVSPDTSRPPPLVLKNLRVEHGVRCRIARPQEDMLDSRFSLVHCQSEDEILHRYFLDLMETVVAVLPQSPTADAIVEGVDRMATLFQNLQEPPRRTVQGLWGELFLISKAREPALIVRAWHNEVCEHFDFAAEAQRLEVKTSITRSRSHNISFPQADPPEGVQAVFVSMFVERTAAGKSVGELWDMIHSSVTGNTELRLKIDEVCLETLGVGWREAREARFDGQLARTSLALYDSRDIPRIAPALPLGVSDVRYRSDFAQGVTLRLANRPTTPLLDWLDLA